MLIGSRTRVRFIGPNAARRAQEFADEFDGKCELDGESVKVKRDINIGERGITAHDLGIVFENPGRRF